MRLLWSQRQNGWFLLLLIITNGGIQGVNTARGYLKDIQCKILVEGYVDIDMCELRLVEPNVQALYVTIKPLKPHFDNITVRVQVMKKEKTFRPFVVDTIIDACKFLRTRQRNYLVKYAFSFLEPYSNLNHTCPYNHAIIVNGMRINSALITRAKQMFPSGEYAFFTTWMANKIKVLIIKLFIKYEEKEPP